MLKKLNQGWLSLPLLSASGIPGSLMGAWRGAPGWDSGIIISDDGWLISSITNGTVRTVSV
jgi:hypothetical protein